MLLYPNHAPGGHISTQKRRHSGQKKKANESFLHWNESGMETSGTTTQRGRLPFGLTLQVRDWLSAGSSAQAAAEPTMSTDSDLLGNLSDTLFSGEDLHMSAWGQEREGGRAGRRRERRSWWLQVKNKVIFLNNCIEKEAAVGLEFRVWTTA